MSRRRRNDAGTAAIEAGILLPVLALLFFGAVEYGFAWRSASTVESAGSSAARMAAQAGDDTLADWEILQTVRGALGSDVSSVERLVIYDSTDPDGAVPSSCLTASAAASGGVPGVCSVYQGDDLASLTLTAFTAGSPHNGGTGNPCGGALANGWCPPDRVDDGLTPTMIGIHLAYAHTRVTQFLPGTGETITAHAVARLEPSS